MPEQLSLPISTGCSKIIETVYDTDATLSDVRAIAEGLELLRSKLVVKAEKEVVTQLARTAKAVAQGGPSPTPASGELATTLQNALGLEDLTVESVTKREAELTEEVNVLENDAAALTKEVINLKNKYNMFISWL